MVKVELITGKSHQIRAQLKHLGYPVVGDTKYGIPVVNRYFADAYHVKHQLLHCGNIIFKEIDGPLSYLGGKEYSAFLPEPFRTIEKIYLGNLEITLIKQNRIKDKEAESDGNLEFQRTSWFLT